MSRLVLRILMMLFGVWSFTFVPLQAQDVIEPSFSHEIVLLYQEGRLLRFPTLSPDGSFVIASAELYDRESGRQVREDQLIEVNQYLWELHSVSFLEEIDHHTPMTQISLNGNKRVSYAFSPTHDLLAIKTDDEVQLWSLPNLQLQDTLSVSVSPITLQIRWPLSWSADGQLLGVLASERILVWDSVNNTVTTNNIDFHSGTLISIDNGWLIVDPANAYSRTSDTTFIVCSSHLEDCNPYNYPEHTSDVVISPNGETVLTSRGDIAGGSGISAVWERQLDGNYEIIAENIINEPPLNAEHGFCPKNFSPNGEYIFSICWPYATIWDFSTFVPLSDVDTTLDTIWLPSSEYLVTYRDFTLSLFHVRSDRATDTLDLRTLFGSEQLSMWVEHGAGAVGYMEVSRDGTKLLLNLGWAALIIRIMYP